MVSMESIKYNKKRKPLAVMLKKADEYIKKYDLGQSPEELFIEFEMIVRIREEFEQCYRALPKHDKPEDMQRTKRMLEKRRIFMGRYLLKNNERYAKEVVHELAEITFASWRNVYKILNSGK